MKATYLGNFPLICGPEIWPAIIPVYTITLPIMIGNDFILPVFTRLADRLRGRSKTQFERHVQTLPETVNLTDSLLYILYSSLLHWVHLKSDS